MRSLVYEVAKKILPAGFRRYLIGIKNAAIANFIFLAHHANMEKPIIWLWKRQLKKLNIDVCDTKGTILVFNSPGGLDDIESAYLDERSPYLFEQIDGELIKASCKYYLGAGITDYNGLLDAASAAAREKYRVFVRELLVGLERDVGLIGIVNFNHVYHAQRDVARVAREMGMPFLTLLKECLRTPKYNQETEYVNKHIIKSYEGSIIGVHNEMTKNVLLNSGIVSEEQIELVGQGRSDNLFRMRRLKAGAADPGRKCILYLVISETAGLPYFGNLFAPSEKGELPALTWGGLAGNVWNLIFEYVESRSDVSLIVKGKPSGVYGKRLAGGHGNVRFVHGTPDMSLYEKADVVVGFNTTGLVEAVAAGVPALTTYFEIDEEKMKPYLFDWYGCVDVVHDKDEFFAKLDKYLFQRAQPDMCAENMDKLLSGYLGNADGKAGERIRKFLRDNLSGVAADYN